MGGSVVRLACACGDKACALKCAAAKPSPKALPVALCINSKCASDMEVAAPQDIDCSKATCQKDCECAKTNCADSVNACLADATCAKGQSCAFACACGDKACALKCAAANPSPKALPVALCINSKCASDMEVAAPEDIDCSKATCQKDCECAKTNCADGVNACLADVTCAKGQSCAFACA